MKWHDDHRPGAISVRNLSSEERGARCLIGAAIQQKDGKDGW